MALKGNIAFISQVARVLGHLDWSLKTGGFSQFVSFGNNRTSMKRLH